MEGSIVRRIKSLVPIVIRYLEYANRVLSALAMLVIATLVVIVSWQVLMRYFFEEPTPWVFELAEYGMVLIVFLPLALAEEMGQHIRVDAITMRLSSKRNKQLNIITLSLSLFYVGLFVWSAVRYARLAYEAGWNSGPYKLGLDQWPILGLLAIGLIFLWLNLLVSLIRQIVDIIPKDQDASYTGQDEQQST